MNEIALVNQHIKDLERELAEVKTEIESHAKWAKALLDDPESEPYAIIAKENAQLRAKNAKLNKEIMTLRLLMDLGKADKSMCLPEELRGQAQSEGDDGKN